MKRVKEITNYERQPTSKDKIVSEEAEIPKCLKVILNMFT